MFIRRFILFIATAIIAAGCGIARADDTLAATQPANQQSLLSNGNFTQMSGDWPTDWPTHDNVTAETEGDAHYLHFVSPETGTSVLIYRRMKLPTPAPAGLELRVKVRYDITAGDKSWFDARIMSHFKNSADAVLKPDPPQPNFHGKSKGWVTKSVYFRIPKGAAYLEIMPSLLNVASGTMDLGECDMFPAPESKLPKPPPMIPSKPLPAPTAAGTPPELHVVGNELQTADGKQVILQGLCLDSLEWSAKGEHLSQSIPEAIEKWHANAIRLPMGERFWWGQGPYQKRDPTGMAYRKVIDKCIAQTTSRGAYLILDLHRFGLPDEADITFWKDAANRYKNNPAVLFELFNEPHSLGWSVWQNGGTIVGHKHKDANVAENKEAIGQSSVGMQALVDAVRSTGAKNIVIAGGIDWSYDLSGVVNGHALHDEKGGDGIMYSSHNYPWKKNWQHNVLDAATKYPIFVGEVGCPEKWSDFKFIPKSQQFVKLGPGCTWPADVIGMMQKYKLNWTGFSFHPKCGPEVISDWNYTPTPYWGKYVQEALAGKKFDMPKMR